MSEETFEPQFSIAEAKTQLTKVVREAERGKVVQLTRRGEPVAVVLSQGEYRKLRAAARKEKPMGWMDAINQWRAETGGVEWPELDEVIAERRKPQRPRPNPFEE
jgi:prevent-host-death family protein